MSHKKLVFIGAGKMAEALMKGILKAEVFLPRELGAADVDVERLDYIKKTYGATVYSDNQAAAAASDIILLSVKPQHIDKVLRDIKAPSLREKLLISIAAGVSTEHIKDILGAEIKLIRVMPNAPALAGAGISALALPPVLSDEDRRTAAAIFNSVGETVFLDESLINQVTAVSGSGPAYFFYFVQALSQAGAAIGLSAETAVRLAKATMSGAAAMLAATDMELADLIDMVASKGGTTEAALNSFAASGFSDIIARGVTAAWERAKELDSLN